jgi:DNA-binding MarR family transcriptional regulator
VDEVEIARQVVEIVPAIMQIVAAELRHAEYPMVPTQIGVLTLLAHHSCNLSELAVYHAVSLPTMSNTISKMVKLGWVQRTRSPHDRRMLLIEITEEGLAVWEQIGRQVISAVTDLLRPISGSEREMLLAGLAVLRRAFAVVPQPFPLEFSGGSSPIPRSS